MLEGLDPSSEKQDLYTKGSKGKVNNRIVLMIKNCMRMYLLVLHNGDCLEGCVLGEPSGHSVDGFV